MDEQRLWIDNGAVWASGPEEECPRCVCAAGDPEAQLLDRFVGAETLEEIARAVADTFHLDPVEGFRRTRDFFLVLAVNGLCAPINTTLWSDARGPSSPAADDADEPERTGALREA